MLAGLPSWRNLKLGSRFLWREKNCRTRRKIPVARRKPISNSHTCVTRPESWGPTTLVGGERSHHFSICFFWNLKTRWWKLCDCARTAHALSSAFHRRARFQILLSLKRLCYCVHLLLVVFFYFIIIIIITLLDDTITENSVVYIVVH